ncbi:hypothetical protein HUJ04_007224 [Dendroctonus ponderosae]|nr:hypothetical protein HUJ04_007224 [Dendroctonus ponderosae]
MEFIKSFGLVMFLLTMIICVFAARQDLKDHYAASSEPRGKRQFHHVGTGPVLTFVKTDKDAHFKWGVRHHAGNQEDSGKKIHRKTPEFMPEGHPQVVWAHIHSDFPSNCFQNHTGHLDRQPS